MDSQYEQDQDLDDNVLLDYYKHSAGKLYRSDDQKAGKVKVYTQAEIQEYVNNRNLVK